MKLAKYLALALALTLFASPAFAQVSEDTSFSPNTAYVWSALQTFTVAPTAPSYVSTVATGTAPFTVSSTTVVPNLNVSFLNGTSWAAPGNIGGTTPGTGTFTILSKTDAGVTGTFTSNNINYNSSININATNNVSLNSDITNIGVAAKGGSIGSLSVRTPDDVRFGASGSVTDVGFQFLPQNCGSIKFQQGVNTGFQYAAAHFCGTSNFTGTIVGATLTSSAATGSAIGQGQRLNYAGCVNCAWITGGGPTNWTLNTSPGDVSGVAMTGASIANASLIVRPPNSNENSFQFAQSDGKALRAESGWSTTYLVSGSNGLPTFQNGDIAFQKETDAGAAPGTNFFTLKAVAGTAVGSCKLIAYAGTSTVPTTIIDNVGSGC